MIQTAPIDVNEQTPDETIGLAAVRDLFQRLNQHDIRYCHWKSNLRLAEALNGRTDLDLLVDPVQQQHFRQILRDADIKHVLSPPGKQYPGLEDHLGFDAESGTQFHLHIHYQLVLGEQFVKNYHIPLEKAFLDSVYLRYGIKIPSPELELIILSLRALLKYRDRDVIKDVFTIRTPGIPDHIAAEVYGLLAQTTVENVTQVLRDIGDIIPADIVLAFLETMQTAPRAGRVLFRLRQRLRRALRGYQRRHRLGATLIYFQELWRRRNTFLRFTPPPQMTFPDGGLRLALVGIDGAGKTTLTGAVAEWLAWKLDVHLYYLGSKQPSRPSKWSYLFFRMARRSHRELSGQVGEGNVISRLLQSVRDALLYSHYLFTGVDRYRRYRTGGRQAQAGSVVIYDRYPLEAPLDGPQIHLAANGDGARGAAVFSRMEQRLYRQMRLPELLLVLEVSPAVAWQRKPDHQWEVIVEKNEVLERLTAVMEANGSPPVRIDASLPLAEVLGRIKQEIWQRLGTQHDC
jgi:thymidylate kinase